MVSFLFDSPYGYVSDRPLRGSDLGNLLSTSFEFIKAGVLRNDKATGIIFSFPVSRITNKAERNKKLTKCST